MKEVRRTIKYAFLKVFIKFLLFCCQVFPRRWVLGFFSSLGSLSHRLFKKEVKLIKKNLEYIHPDKYSDQDKNDFSRKVFTNIAKNAADIFISSKYKTPEELDHIIIDDGFENFEKAYKKGNGVIILTCHLGSFEFTALNAALKDYKVNIVAKKLKNNSLNQILEKFRTSNGAKMIYSGESAIQIIKAIKRQESVVMLIDQDIKRSKGVFVDFMGRRAYTPIGATMVALRTGASVVPMAVRRTEDNKHIMTTLPELELIRTGDKQKDIEENTQLFNDTLENLINLDPTQWVWMHRRWKTKPEDIKRLESEKKMQPT